MSSEIDNHAIALHSRQLEVGLSSLFEQAPAAGLQELHIVLPELPFLLALIEFDSTHLAVKTVMEAWSIGLTTQLIIHRQLLPLLPVSPLMPLPVTIQDHQGMPVYLCDRKWINYRDVALYSHCWLLTQTDAQFTELAREHMDSKQIQLACKRSWNVSR